GFTGVIDLLRLDWRDVLVAGGVAHGNWPTVLDRELAGAPAIDPGARQRLTARFGDLEAWFEALPDALTVLARRWGLDVGSPIPRGGASAGQPWPMGDGRGGVPKHY